MNNQQSVELQAESVEQQAKSVEQRAEYVEQSCTSFVSTLNFYS